MEMQEKLLKLQEKLVTHEWVTSGIHIKRLSKDFFWFSPILFKQLADKKADIVARPQSEEQLIELVAECAVLNIPITIRGGGTGNYGQSVPLDGGIVVDMAKYDGINWINEEDGIAFVKAGTKLSHLEDTARDHGWELRCMPSTYKMATIAGLFSGGFGGIGSINYGPIVTPGNVLALKVMTVEERPKVFEVRGKDLLTFHHTYGTNGIILDVEIALAPARRWDEYMLSFDSLEQALSFSKKMTENPAIEKRNIALFDAKSASHFEQTPITLENNQFIVITAVALNSSEAMNQLMKENDGCIVWQQSFKEVLETDNTLLENCWNHSTLHALKNDKSLTYLQASYEYERIEEQLILMGKLIGDEIQIHLEFILSLDGKPTIAGLPLIHYSTPERLSEIITIHEKSGISISNPHVYTLEDGKHDGKLSMDIINSKKENDPHLLLNKNKIRSLSNL